MSNQANTPASQNQATVVVTDAALAGSEGVSVAAPVVKAPTKKSQAQAIFDAKVAKREAGEYASNKDFRADVLGTIELELGVSRASASTMYNSFKKEVETTGVIVLGRDPKKEKAPSTGKRGRPAGSSNKAKTETPNVIVVDVQPPAAEEVAAEVVAEPVAAEATA